MIDSIQWLGHGSFMLQGPPIVYINPWRVVTSAFLADVILISSDQYDHCSVADVQKLRSDETRIIGAPGVEAHIADAQVVLPWHSVTLDRLSIKAVPAYAPNRETGGGVGFVLSLRYYDIYYAGSCGLVPELDLIKPDIAILPIDGEWRLSVDEAAAVVAQMQPRWVIPSHWGGSNRVDIYDAKRFASQVGERTQVILPVRKSAGAQS